MRKRWWIAGAAKLDFEKQMVNLAEVPIGVTQPASYSGGDISPTPRQFREMIFAGRYDEAIASVSKFSSGAEWNPLYDVVTDTVDHLLAVGQVEPARRMNAAYKEVNTAADIPGYFDSWGDRSILWGAKSDAISYYKRALDLKPDDPKAMEGLKKAEALPKHQDSAN